MRSNEVFSKRNKLFREFDSKMSDYAKRLKNICMEDFWELYNKVSEYQTRQMQMLLSQYREAIGNNEIKNHVAALVTGLIEDSESGNAVIWLDTEELADKVIDAAYDDLGMILLDEEVVSEERSGEWYVDMMFGGCYCPHWDGWGD